MRSERAVVFDCAGDQLTGVLHAGAPEANTGVIIVVGGPQYRVGSHRQFVLLARRLASAGFPVLRFDFRGMGDAEGSPRSFESVDDDICAAADALQRLHGGIRGLVLLGLCDAASACLMYALRDPRLAGLVLMNPWVRTVETQATVYLRHYYGQRLLQKSFWQKLAARQFDLRRSATEFFASLRTARSSGRRARDRGRTDFIERMRVGFAGFGKPILLFLSGRDLAASEFSDLCLADPRWQSALKNPETVVQRFPEADHTFSARADLESLADHCIAWLATVSGHRAPAGVCDRVDQRKSIAG